MKTQFLATMVTAPALAIGATISFAQSGTAATTNIACNLNTSTPVVTVAVSDREQSQEVIMLSFVSQYFSPQVAQENCQTTATTLQALFENGKMNYLASDTVGGQPTVCAVQRRGVGCNSNSATVLFALDRDIDPTQALYDMLGDRFKQSKRPDSRTISRIYTDIKPRNWWPWPL